MVIENLRDWKPKGGRRKSSLKQRFHGWVKSAIADRLEQLGQEHGKKIVSVYARGTSSTAYDGTGKVKRDKDNYALGTFSTGKRYAIDLSASYNIAARYIAHKLKLAKENKPLIISNSEGMNFGNILSLTYLVKKDTNFLLVDGWQKEDFETEINISSEFKNIFLFGLSEKLREQLQEKYQTKVDLVFNDDHIWMWKLR